MSALHSLPEQLVINRDEYVALVRLASCVGMKDELPLLWSNRGPEMLDEALERVRAVAPWMQLKSEVAA